MQKTISNKRRNFLNKILIIPDLHGKEIWKSAIKEKEWDTIVFLGDYVDAFHMHDYEIVSNLQNIISFKKENYDKVILLFGNHDVQYLKSSPLWHCSGYRESYAPTLYTIFKDNERLFKYVHKIDNFLFTHAGVHKEWWDSTERMRTEFHLTELTIDKQLHLLASTRYEEVFSDCGYYRGGRYPYGGPLWSDLSEFKKPQDTFQNLIQIVGHSQVSKPFKKHNVDIWYSDCLDTVAEFLYIEDNKIKTFQIKQEV